MKRDIYEDTFAIFWVVRVSVIDEYGMDEQDIVVEQLYKKCRHKD